jgi:hypothetical protein
MFFQKNSKKGDAAFSFNFGGNDEPKGFSNSNTEGSFQNLSQGNRSPKRNRFDFGGFFPKLPQESFGQPSGFNSASTGFKTPSGKSFSFKSELNLPPLPNSDQSTKPSNLGGVSSGTLNGLSALFDQNNSSTLDDISSTAKGFDANLKNTDFLFDRSAKPASPTSFNLPKPSSENVPNLIQNVGEIFGVKGTPNSLQNLPGISSALGNIDRLEQPAVNRSTSDQIDPNLNLDAQNIQGTDFSNSDQSKKDGFPIKTLAFDPDEDSQNRNLDSNLSFNDDFNQELDALAAKGDVEGLTAMKNSVNKSSLVSSAFQKKVNSRVDNLVNNIKNGVDTDTSNKDLNGQNFRTIGLSEKDQLQKPDGISLSADNFNQKPKVSEKVVKSLEAYDDIIRSNSENRKPDKNKVMQEVLKNEDIDPRVKSVIFRGLNGEDVSGEISRISLADQENASSAQGDPSSSQTGSQDNPNIDGNIQPDNPNRSQDLTDSTSNSPQKDSEIPDDETFVNMELSITPESSRARKISEQNIEETKSIQSQIRGRDQNELDFDIDLLQIDGEAKAQADSDIENIVGEDGLDDEGHLTEKRFETYQNHIKSSLAKDPASARQIANDIAASTVLTKRQKRQAILAGFIKGDRFDVNNNPILKQMINNMPGREKFLAGMGQNPSNHIHGIAEIYSNFAHKFGLMNDAEFESYKETLDEFQRLSKPLLQTGAGATGNFLGSQLMGLLPLKTASIPFTLGQSILLELTKPVGKDKDFLVTKISQLREGLENGIGGIGVGKIKAPTGKLGPAAQKLITFMDKQEKSPDLTKLNIPKLKVPRLNSFTDKKQTQLIPKKKIRPSDSKKSAAKKNKKNQKPKKTINQKSPSPSAKSDKKNDNGDTTTNPKKDISQKQSPKNRKDSTISKNASKEIKKEKKQTDELTTQLNRAFKGAGIAV